MKEKILVTGGAGFIGHHFIEHVLRNTDWNVIVLDRLNYASKGFDRLRDISCFDEDRVKLFTADLTQPLSEGLRKEIGQIDYVVHMAAETHVDRSISDPRPFVFANVVGTMELLEFCRHYQRNVKKIVYFSTDEVFGPAPHGTAYKEWDRYNCTNPYSATKAGGEELALAYANTYDMPVIITHTMNVIGERQHPEKFVPLCINKILNGEMVHIHSDSNRQNAGSRMYIHARNVADALLFLLKKGQRRDKYNIVGEEEVDNLTLAKGIAKILNKELKYRLVDFHSSRPGHDLRYALDGEKMKELGWEPPKKFWESLEKTIKWTINRPEWLKEV